MKHFFFIILFLAVGLYCAAKVVKGKVFSGDTGIPSVVVTDGTHFTQTDAKGFYSMDADDAAPFVYIVTPSGFVGSFQSGTPVFYKPLDGKDFDFKLFRWGQSEGSYALFAVGDPQPKGENAFNRLENEAFADLRTTGKDYLDRGTHTIGIFLGDLLWDNLDKYSYLKSRMSHLGFPVYPVIGNHDHDYKVADDFGSAHLYRSYFGPTYYAFNAGKEYYIVLDNIIYKGNKTYDCGLTADELDWVRGYIRYIPKGSNVFVAMHCPAYIYYSKRTLAGVKELLDMLSDYKVDILSGHSHIQSNRILRPNVMEHMVASIGGAWWLWDCKYCKDGTPLGYQVFESLPYGMTNYFKSLGRDRNYQFRAFPVGTVSGHIHDLCVKVWNWNLDWKVRWYEDGRSKGQMKQYAGTDPDYSDYLERKYAQGFDKVGKGHNPSHNVPFFFYATPSRKANSVKVVVTDAEGNEYSKSFDVNHL